MNSFGTPFRKKEEYMEASGPGRPEPAQPQPPHKPGEPEHPRKPTEPRKPDDPGVPGDEPQPEPYEKTAPPQVAFTADQFQSIISTVIQEARKPVRDERTVARLKRMKEHNRAMQKDSRQMLIARFHNCNHMQMPGSVMTGCACIAWATQSDGIKRGTCQHCGTIFSSKREECLSDEIHEAYKMLVRLPTHPAGNINSIFQSA